jgi:hypothetical protein
MSSAEDKLTVIYDQMEAAWTTKESAVQLLNEAVKMLESAHKQYDAAQLALAEFIGTDLDTSDVGREFPAGGLMGLLEGDLPSKSFDIGSIFRGIF